jgi:hypothetical protein
VPDDALTRLLTGTRQPCRREAQRTRMDPPLTVDVQYHDPAERHVTAYVSELSLTGALLSPIQHIAPAAKIQIRELEPYAIAAKVVAVTLRGLHVQFETDLCPRF